LELDNKEPSKVQVLASYVHHVRDVLHDVHDDLYDDHILELDKGLGKELERVHPILQPRVRGQELPILQERGLELDKELSRVVDKAPDRGLDKEQELGLPMVLELEHPMRAIDLPKQAMALEPCIYSQGDYRNELR